jgi:hypothetical protein
MTEHTTTATRPTMEDSRLRTYGAACAASGVLGVIAGLLTPVLYDSAVPSNQWSYPLSTTTQWVLSLGLAIMHVLSAMGFLGVLRARPYGEHRAAAATLRIAVAGFAILSIAELLSGAIGAQDVDSVSATWVGTLFGVASLMTALGGLVAGTVIVRTNRWTGTGAWMVLASGVVMLVLVTPANVTGNLAFRTVALTLWSLTFVPLGRTLTRSRVG